MSLDLSSPRPLDPPRLGASLALLLAGLLLPGCSSSADQEPQPPAVEQTREESRARVTLQFHDEPLQAIVPLLAASSGEPVVCVLPASDPIPLSVDLVNVPWDQAVEILAAASGVDAVWQTTEEGRRLVLGRDLHGGSFRPVPTPAPEGPLARGRAPVTDPSPDLRIEVDVEDMDLAEVMEQIAAKSGARIEVDPNVSECVSVSLRQIPWREAVEVIAKMTRTEVHELREGGLLIYQPGDLHISYCNASARTVAQLLAAYSGKSLVLAPGALSGETTVEIRSDLAPGTLPGAMAGLLHSNGAELFALHGAWIVAPKGSRPELEEARVPLGAKPLAEPPASPASGLRARARGVAAHDWLKALATYAGESLFVGRDVRGSIDRPWAPLSLLREFWTLSRERGWKLDQQAAYLMIHGESQVEQPAAAAKPTRRSLTLPSGEKVVVELQALLIPPPEDERQHPAAILSGQLYYPRDRLVDAEEGKELPVEVVKVLSDRVVFKIEGREDKRYVVPFDEKR